MHAYIYTNICLRYLNSIVSLTLNLSRLGNCIIKVLEKVWEKKKKRGGKRKRRESKLDVYED